jgi:hypothetical protein
MNLIEYLLENGSALTVEESQAMDENIKRLFKKTGHKIVAAQPDPATGLVPCGCGGALKFERFNDGFFDLERIACECGIEITSGPGFCKPAWNRAMGWREKE